MQSLTIQRLFGALALAFVLAQSTACGLWHRVDRSRLNAIPNDEKLALFDAENGVYIARDEVLTVERAQKDAERALLRARRYRSVIDERKSSAGGVDTPSTLALLEEWNEKRVALRELEVDLVSERLDVAKARLWTARAEYEQAKAKLVKEKDPVEAESIDLEAFAEQLKARQETEAEEVAEMTELEAEVLALRAEYRKLGERLQRESRGAYGGPWADLVGGTP